MMREGDTPSGKGGVRGVGSAAEQKNPEVRIMFVKRADSHKSGASFVRRRSIDVLVYFVNGCPVSMDVSTPSIASTT